MNALSANALLLAVCCLSSAFCTPAFSGGEADAMLANADGSTSNSDKRAERYAFGLGRRAYMYTNGGTGMKRLPVYNFGLGKRSDNNNNIYDQQYDQQYDYNNLPAAAAYMADEKRNRPYSFGLGKREMLDLNQRSMPQRYGFGLGRR